MSDHEDLKAKMRENERLLAENREQQAYIRGQFHSAVDALASDPEHVDMLRALAWARTGKTFTMSEGKIAGVPEGWPEGVDPDAFVAEDVEARKAAYDPFKDAGVTRPADRPVSPAVRRFRELLG